MKLRIKEKPENYTFLSGPEKKVLLQNIVDFYEGAELIGPYEYQITLDNMLSIIVMLKTTDDRPSQILGDDLYNKCIIEVPNTDVELIGQ